MMHHYYQDMFLGSHLHDSHAQHGAMGEVKGPVRFLLYLAPHGGLAFPRWEPRNIVALHCNCGMWLDDLHWARIGLREGRSQNFVPPHDFGYGVLNRPKVESTL